MSAFLYMLLFKGIIHYYHLVFIVTFTPLRLRSLVCVIWWWYLEINIQVSSRFIKLIQLTLPIPTVFVANMWSETCHI